MAVAEVVESRDVAPSPHARGDVGRARWARMARPLAVVPAAVAVLSYVAVVDPHAAGHYPTCPFLWLTGLYCPGCGALRALHDLAHRDLGGAWGMNPLVVAAIPLLLFCWFTWLRRATLGRERTWAAPGAAIWSLFGLVVVFGIARNIPYLAPWLAP
jgi:hypothetical protein